MADLVEHLGIGRASLYATFGSKHDLCLKALARFLRRVCSATLVCLSRPGAALPLVRCLVERYARECAADVHRRGCTVVKAAIARLPGVSLVARRVKMAWA